MGINLGLKDCATASNEQQLHGRWYRGYELELAKAQRAKKKKRVKAIHAKIKNQRKDDMHQFSTTLVRENAAIFVGDVASAKLVKTKMAKSTLDAWLLLTEDDVGNQEPSGRYRLYGSERSVFNPDLLVLRGHTRQQSER